MKENTTRQNKSYAPTRQDEPDPLGWRVGAWPGASNAETTVIAEVDGPPQASVSFRLSAQTHAGGMPRNEDACSIIEMPGQSLVVIADGAGGHALGEVASDLVIRSVREYVARTHLEGGALLLGALEAAQTRVRREIGDRPGSPDMRSTALIALVQRTKFWIGHVGATAVLTWCVMAQGATARRRQRTIRLFRPLSILGRLTARPRKSTRRRT